MHKIADSFESLKEQVKDYYELTPVMFDHYSARTNKHISLFEKYYALLVGPNIAVEEHDSSKFEQPELPWYIAISWMYFCKRNNLEFTIRPELQDKMDLATEHHILSNDHHPEYWSDQMNNLIVKGDRDSADVPNIIDATQMPRKALYKMVADWCAMSEELGNDPNDWADKVINKRWKFDKSQQQEIYWALNTMWG